MRTKSSECVPDVIAIYRSQRVYPMSHGLSVGTDVWCVFFKMDDKLTYWLMDNKQAKKESELDAWRRFIKEWMDPSYDSYKRKVVMGRNMDDADVKWAVFNPSQVQT